MSLLLDFLLVLIFALSIYTGVKKGFIRSVMGIVVVIFSILGSVKLAPAFSSYLNEKYIDEDVTAKVEKSISSIISESVNLDKLFEEKPEPFSNILEKFGIDFDELKNYYENMDKDSAEAEQEIAAYIAEPVAKAISKALAFAILFIIFTVVLTIIVLVIDLIVKIPVLRGINKGLGLLLGILKGGLFAWGISLIFCNLLPQLAIIYEGKIPDSIIENTVIVKFLGAINISSLF